MPVNAPLASDIWLRYQYIRDNGHLDYVHKAKKCEDFFAGLQWDANDLALLRNQRRPALTINKIISTMSNVMGEQIYNRSQISFRPRNEGATQALADTLTKVFMQIDDNNQLTWVRSDVFTDGIITSRGFYDVRMDFADSARGEVRITQLNPKNVLIDPDGEEYDPDKWNDVFVTKWMSPDMISMLYSKEDGEWLRGRQEAFFPYGYDSIDRERDRFGTPRAVTYGMGMVASLGMVRNIRVIERQYKVLDRRDFFVNTKTGDLREIPSGWERDRIAVYLQQNPEWGTVKKLAPRIRWTVVADNLVLHDDWSPYKRFTVVPYFPYFRRGRTLGLVENLLGPQELLNKVSSQELHVVNTTANSGWKIKKGALRNMSIAELENRGAQTGLVLELDDIDGAEKITPNNTPQGLDRITYKAEESIKGISGVSDSMQGFDREDVSAKAIKQKTARGSTNLAKPMDSLQRSDHILARAVLDLVQDYYTEERIMHIVTDKMMGTTQELRVNEVTPEGEVVNDLTIGEYEVVVALQPERDTFEDSQFDQAVAMLEKGIPIPPETIVQSSRLRDKAEIVEKMTGNQNSPEAQAQKALQARMAEAEVSEMEAGAMLKVAQAKKASAEADQPKGAGMDGEQEFNAEMVKLQQEFQLKQAEMEQKFALEREKMEREFQLKAEMQQAEIGMKQQESKAKEAALYAQSLKTPVQAGKSKESMQ